MKALVCRQRHESVDRGMMQIITVGLPPHIKQIVSIPWFGLVRQIPNTNKNTYTHIYIYIYIYIYTDIYIYI